jgi:transcriptional regulator with XRE-family HTH domain
MKHIGRVIKSFREDLGVSIEFLAKNTRIKPRLIRQFEKGYEQPSLKIIDKLCKYFQISFSDFAQRCENYQNHLHLFDCYHELREFLSDESRNILDNTLSDIKGEGYKIQFLGITSEIPYIKLVGDTYRIRKNIEKDRIKTLADYINILSAKGLIVSGKMGVFKFDLARISPTIRFCYVAYLGFDLKYSKEDINNILGVELSIGEGELPKIL